MSKAEIQRNNIIKQDLAIITNYSLNWKKLEGKTILITGASGFLPAYLVETILFLNENLFSLPAKIIGIVRNLSNAKQKFSIYSDREDLLLLNLDISVPIELETPIHFVIHAASQASPMYYKTDPVGTLVPNTIGTYNLLQLALKHPVESFLFFSSGEVYGEVDNTKIPTRETDYGFVDPMNVRSCYGESKRMGETMCASFFGQYEIPVKIVRPFHTYGPGMKLDDGRVFADFVSDIVNNRDIIMKSDGSAIRAFCYLTDATIGFFTVLLNGLNGQAYNVGNPNGETSILNLATLLTSLFPEKGLRVIRNDKTSENYLKSNISRNCPDISKMNQLGWHPVVSVQDGFKRTIQSYIL